MSTHSSASPDSPSPVPPDATAPPGDAPNLRIASPNEVARPTEITRPPAVPRPSGPADAAAVAVGGASPPPWLRTLASQLGDTLVTGHTRPGPRAVDARRAAVLILFGAGPDGPDVLLLERAAELRSHASQPAFPGGAADATDIDRVDTALREAAEEVGLDPAGVEVLAVAPPLHLQASHYLVTPVLAWWHTPCAVAPVDLAETSFVSRVPLTELADPANRVILRYAQSDLLSPAFQVHGMLVWGFTAGILDILLRLGGWERPWNHSAVVDHPPTRAVPTTSPPPPR